MAILKRLIIVLALVAAPLGLGLLFTYDIIKIDWVSFMEIQNSFNPQEDPLPVPARSVPVEGAAYIAALGAPANPVAADEDRSSAARRSMRLPAASATVQKRMDAVRSRPFWPINRSACWKAGR